MHNIGTIDLFPTFGNSIGKLMNPEELVKFLKYETDLDRLFDSTAGYYFQNQLLPSPTEAQRIKIALAISDQIEGKHPQSTDAIYLAAYKIAESV
ncbi:hypothetical protein QUB24_09370 [Microcoleus sp. B9-D4]